jgi:predicted transcriptional regulator of viral defense system
MSTHHNPTVRLLRQQFGIRPFRVSEAVAAGASRTTLHRLRDQGLLEAGGRGVLLLPGGGTGAQSSLAKVFARAPGSTVCLNSALAYWDLSDEIPAQVHIAVARGAHLPVISQPPTKVHVFDAQTFSLERQQASTDVGEPFWIYSAERSVVDAVRMSRWVGRDVALHALRRYTGRPGASPAHVAELADKLGGHAAVSRALEALLS